MRPLFYALLLSLPLPLLKANPPIETKQKHSFIMRSPDGGLFSVFQYVLVMCKYYNNNYYKGLKVDFAKTGLYYTPSHGNNWWEYYFMPIVYGELRHAISVKGTPKNISHWEIECNTSRSECFNLINKYVKLRPFLEEMIDQFYTTNLKGHYVITVHYRGTDKSSESPRVPYEDVVSKIFELITTENHQNYKLFIATDEQPFIDFMVETFGNMVCYNPNAIRSTNNEPIHTGNTDRYQCGLEAVMDCLLLSKGDIMIRTSSNLSLCASYFNPEIPIIELSKRRPSKKQ